MIYLIRDLFQVILTTTMAQPYFCPGGNTCFKVSCSKVCKRTFPANSNGRCIDITDVNGEILRPGCKHWLSFHKVQVISTYVCPGGNTCNNVSCSKVCNRTFPANSNGRCIDFTDVNGEILRPGCKHLLSIHKVQVILPTIILWLNLTFVLVVIILMGYLVLMFVIVHSLLISLEIVLQRLMVLEDVII